jgi:single-strand DNA-binding protein
VASSWVVHSTSYAAGSVSVPRRTLGVEGGHAVLDSEEGTLMNDTYITLTGWVGSDVSLREVAGGQPVANFRVATTSRRFRNNRWEDGTTTWYSVRAWRRLADNVTESIRRGDPVVVHGRLEADVWTKEDGTTNTQLVITATSVGHDLSRGTAVFSKPTRAEGVASGETLAPASTQTVDATDPWAAPLSQPMPAFAADEPTPQAAPEADAA